MHNKKHLTKSAAGGIMVIRRNRARFRPEIARDFAPGKKKEKCDTALLCDLVYSQPWLVAAVGLKGLAPL